jgi:hypothetical protein
MRGKPPASGVGGASRAAGLPFAGLLLAGLPFAGLALASLLLAGLSGCTLDMKYDKYAIVYGIADYGGSLSSLQYPDDDADSMSLLLANRGYTVTLRKNSEATKAQLLTDIDGIVLSGAGEDDLFLFYFSGHGGQWGTGPEPVNADSAEEWISLYGSGYPPDLGTTFSDDALVDALQAIPCRKKVIILDSCNSGGFIANALEADGTPPSAAEGAEDLGSLLSKSIRMYANFTESSADIPPWKALVISAAGERESSWDAATYGHGVFTYYLLEAARQGDANGDGWVTVTEAFAYAKRMIYRDWNSYYGSYYAFSPHVSGGPVDYVLFEAR